MIVLPERVALVFPDRPAERDRFHLVTGALELVDDSFGGSGLVSDLFGKVYMDGRAAMIARDSGHGIDQPVGDASRIVQIGGDEVAHLEHLSVLDVGLYLMAVDTEYITIGILYRHDATRRRFVRAILTKVADIA